MKRGDESGLTAKANFFSQFFYDQWILKIILQNKEEQ